jgi:hypothetical protein
MDHAALFAATATIAGAAVNGVSVLDCSFCHAQSGSKWADGIFHGAIGAAVPQDCAACHYPLMADATSADVTSGTQYRMAHRSVQVALQNCGVCHSAALANAGSVAVSAWRNGAFHASVLAQPTACVDCHAVSEPAPGVSTASNWSYSLVQGGTSTNGSQWMNHGSSSVTGLDCVRCHAADARAAGAAWSKSTLLHAVITAPATCQECHGLTNGGGGAVGTNNNLPLGLTSASTVSTAGQDPTTGVPAGTHDQITHADVNVSTHDCNLCHAQVGISSTAGVAGNEWAQAHFHASFSPTSPLVMNGTTGRCSNCHLNVKPGAGFTGQDHGGFTNTSGSQDCSACHSWPGTGTSTAPNWLGASAAPQYISVGAFTIPAPPAATPATQLGIANLPHPSTAGVACSTCHAGGAGGKGAIGYDHASTLIGANCNACHEAGSNLVGTPWNQATTQAAGAGDTRPLTLSTIRATRGTDSCNVTNPNHFYPVDCHECHNAPTGVATATAGTAYTNAYAFPHTQSKMTNPGTCNMCHQTGCPK